jgi:hypothetical protein
MLARQVLLSLEPHPQPFFLYFVFEIGSSLTLPLPQTQDPPASAVQVAEIVCMPHHAQLQICKAPVYDCTIHYAKCFTSIVTFIAL